MFFRDRDEQSSRRLRIEEQGANLFWDGGVVLEATLSEGAVRLQAAGNVTGANALHCAVQQGHTRGMDAQANARADGHLSRVADQSEAGDVRHAVHLEAGR